MAKLRRRVRQQHPAVLRRIKEAVIEGASAPMIERELQELQMHGKLPADAPIPSTRTIVNIARDLRRDESEPWTLEDSPPSEAALVLRVLSAAARKTRGRVSFLTKREAHVAAIYLAVRPGIEGGPPIASAWRAYVSAREYLSLIDRGDDLSEEHLDLIDRSRIDEGLVYEAGALHPTLKEERS
jgi:hypothetical protein